MVTDGSGVRSHVAKENVMSDQASYASPGQAPARTGGAGFAIAALVLGILAVLSCWTVVGGILLGLVAIILGIVGWRRANRGAATGKGMAITGVVLGTIGLLLSVVFVVFIGSFLNGSDFKNYRQCASDAGNDQAKLQECAKEFNKNLQG